MNKLFYSFLILFKAGFERRLPSLNILLSRNIFNFCCLLRAENFIDFMYINSTSIQIYYKNFYQMSKYPYLFSYLRYFNNFIINSTISKKLCLTYRDLQRLNTINQVKILSTDLGLLTCFECIKKKKGGILICTLTI